MGILNKKESRSIKYSSYWSSNLLEDEGTAKFFAMKESFEAYCYCIEAIQRRMISSKVEDTILLFQDYDYSPEQIDFLVQLLKETARRKANSVKSNESKSNSLYILNNLDEEGVKLLEITENINIQDLKKLYRKASLRYHPDRGGSHLEMVHVNEAFNVFYNALLGMNESYENNEHIKQLNLIPETWEELLFATNLLLACINGDSFAADKSLLFLHKAYLLSLKSSSSFIGNFVQLLFSNKVILKPCEALARLKMRQELLDASKETTYLIDRMFESWVIEYPYDKPSRYDLPDEKSIFKEYGTKLVLNNIEKANNAYRLGKIDKIRFQKIIKKFNRNEFENEGMVCKINKFLLENEVILKLSEAEYNLNVSNPAVVPPPDHAQKRFNHLNDDQKYEYLRIWKRGSNNGNLFLRYYEIRVQEVLLGLIHNYNSIDHVALKNEVRFFMDNFEGRFSMYEIVFEFYQYIEGLNKSVRDEKLKLLKSMDNPEPCRTLQIERMINPVTLEQVNFMRVSVDLDYLDFAKRDNSDLHRYLNG